MVDCELFLFLLKYCPEEHQPSSDEKQATYWCKDAEAPQANLSVYVQQGHGIKRTAEEEYANEKKSRCKIYWSSGERGVKYACCEEGEAVVHLVPDAGLEDLKLGFAEKRFQGMSTKGSDDDAKACKKDTQD